MNPGIIICSRSNSSRIAQKPFQTIKGKMIIQHLLDRLKPLNIPICVAVPPVDEWQYRFVKGNNVNIYSSDADSPLHRMYKAAINYGFDTIIRITHDKILVDNDSLLECLKIMESKDYDYIYSSHLNDGTGFEIFTKCTLEKAVKMFDQDIEHISYAVKCTSPRTLNFKPSEDHYNKRSSDIRFLIDFEEDLDFMKAVFCKFPEGELSLRGAIKAIEKDPYLKKINKQPEITVYTCAYNEEDFIQWAVQSVVSQSIFSSIEFIVIDDASNDGTYKKLLNSKYFSNKLIKLKRNEKNIGLSSSSNIALNMARGKYIMRLDADDALLFPFTLESMLKKAKQENLEALYPNYIDDKSKSVRHGSDNHHVGGCLFLTKTIRNIQFTEGLRGWEGLDLFERAKDQIKIGYYEDLAFFYRNKPNSMSKTNHEYREMIRQSIASGKVGHELLGVPI